MLKPRLSGSQLIANVTAKFRGRRQASLGGKLPLRRTTAVRVHGATAHPWPHVHTLICLPISFACRRLRCPPACACADVVPSSVCAPRRSPVADACARARGGPGSGKTACASRDGSEAIPMCSALSTTTRASETLARRKRRRDHLGRLPVARGRACLPGPLLVVSPHEGMAVRTRRTAQRTRCRRRCPLASQSSRIQRKKAKWERKEAAKVAKGDLELRQGTGPRPPPQDFRCASLH